VRLRLVVALGLVLVLSGACGDDGQRVNADEPTGEVAKPQCVEEVFPELTEERMQQVEDGQRPLREDLEKLRVYGEQHTNEYTQLRWDNGPPVRVVGYFTTNLDAHRAALETQLEHPDKLELRESLQSKDDQHVIMNSLDYGSQLFMGAGPRPNGAVDIHMHASSAARDRAAQLHERHGDLVCISLAGHPYPKGAWPDTSKCPEETRTDNNPSVDFTLSLAKTTFERGETGTGTARITNNGDTAIERITGSAIAGSVTRPDSNEIVAFVTRSETSMGYERRAEPGQTIEVPVWFSTEDCARNSDYVLPPGEYIVSTSLEGFGRSDDVTITVVE
jgi:hypothetical protein